MLIRDRRAGVCTLVSMNSGLWEMASVALIESALSGSSHEVLCLHEVLSRFLSTDA